MRSNKVVFGYEEQIEGIPDAVWVFLYDEKVCTMVSRKEFFDTCMHCGCFIEHTFFPDRDSMNAEAKEKILSGFRAVGPAAFREIEAKGQSARVAKAFAEAERMISEG